MITYTTREDIKNMSDNEFISLLKQCSFQSQWRDKSAFQFAQIRLAHMQGNEYMRTGNINSFRRGF